jgi:hypothetical protein
MQSPAVRRGPLCRSATVVCAAAIWVVAGTSIAGSSPFWLSKSADKEVATWRGGISTQDGGYLLLGSSWEVSKKPATARGSQEEDLHVRLVRLSGDGSLQWVRTYGDLRRSSALGLSASGDSGFCVLAGVYRDRVVGGDGRLWVFKVEGRGGRVWDAYIEGMYNRSLVRPYETFSVAGTKDGGCLVVGGTPTERTDHMQVRAVFVSAEGRILWDRAYGPKQISVGLTVAATETGFLVGGVASGVSDRPGDALLLKLNGDGILLRENRYGEAHTRELAHHVLPLPDGGALLSGSKVTPPNTRPDAWVVRVDRDGGLVWAKVFGNNSGDFFFGARRSPAGQFELFGVSGYSPKGNGPIRALIVTVDESGKSLRQQRFVQPIEELMGIVPLHDGGYLLLGTSLDGPGLVKVDAEGTLTRGR